MRSFCLLAWFTIKNQVANPLPCFTQVSFLIVVLLIFRYLWQTAHTAGSAISAIGNPNDFVWYVLCTELVVMAPPFTHMLIQSDIQAGRFEAQLLRPTSYISTAFAQGIGSLLVRWSLLAVCGAAMVLYLTGSGPTHLDGVMIAMGLSFVASILFLALLISIGLSSAWLGDIVGVHFLATKMAFMLGGLLVPLALYPAWLQTVAWCSPFAPMLNGIARLVFEVRVADLIGTAVLLAAWGGVLMSGAWFIQSRYRLRIARSGN
jgi:ABC-2 type transport system permease protein